MKNYGVIIFCVLLFTASVHITATAGKDKNIFDAAKEQATIMAVIEKETACFFANDYEGWKSTRAQQTYDFQAWNNADGTFYADNGWLAVDKGIKTYTDSNKTTAASKREVLRKNVVCKFYGNTCAYLTWDEYVRDDSSPDLFYKTKDLRLMEKQNGEWKIVSVAAFWDYKNKVKRAGIQ